jgi:DNA polymerase
MLNILWTDLETFSTIDIRKTGSYRYAENCEIMLLSYAMNDSPVSVIDFCNGDTIDEYLLLLDRCDYIGAHNGILFDRPVLLRSKYGKYFENKKWIDPMVVAYQHSLPGSLDKLSSIFKLSEGKMKEGRELIHLFCKPRKTKIIRATQKTHPEKWILFKEYAKRDIIAMREIYKKLPKWNLSEIESAYQMMDMRMNDRGFFVDSVFVSCAIDVLKTEKKIRDITISDITDGTVTAATQRDKLISYILEALGLHLPDLQISTLERVLSDPDIPDEVKNIVSLRMQSAGTSTKKYQRAFDIICSDGRAHGTMQHRGAWRTGRQSGRLLQPHNFPRPQFKADEIAIGIDMIKAGCADLVYESVVPICSSALRGMIIPSPGKKLCVADLSSIEGRMISYLAGEKWKLDAYRDADAGIGYDMYILAYSMTFNVKPDTVTKEQRKLGKILELALGYGGGVGAFITFSKGYGVDLDDLATNVWSAIDDICVEDATRYYKIAESQKKTNGLSEKTFVACDAIKRMWRNANPNVTAFWYDLERAFRTAYSENTIVNISDKICIDRKGSWVRIRLPSGRYLSYPGVNIEDKISFLGDNIYSRKWGRVYTYGGKLSENVVQAASNDYFYAGVLRAEEQNFLPIALVHDEVVTETPDTDEYNSDRLCKLLSINPSWADNFPGNADGFDGYRYGKKD